MADSNDMRTLYRYFHFKGTLSQFGCLVVLFNGNLLCFICTYCVFYFVGQIWFKFGL